MRQVHCSFCHHVLQVPEDWLGRDVKCLACNRMFRPAPEPEPGQPEPAAESDDSALWTKVSRRLSDLFSHDAS
jgi:hypothetical protein